MRLASDVGLGSVALWGMIEVLCASRFSQAVALCGVERVAAEGVSGAPDGSLRHGTGAARLLLASCASNR